jgi:hypothetical protein
MATIDRGGDIFYLAPQLRMTPDRMDTLLDRVNEVITGLQSRFGSER